MFTKSDALPNIKFKKYIISINTIEDIQFQFHIKKMKIRSTYKIRFKSFHHKLRNFGIFLFIYLENDSDRVEPCTQSYKIIFTVFKA